MSYFKNIKQSVAGCVVLYHPDEQVVLNLESYISGFDRFYIIDNSDIQNVLQKKNFGELLKNKKIKYTWLGRNLGIARALNFAADKAIKDGFDWLLTMDQDSKPADQMLEVMAGYIAGLPIDHQVGIVAPTLSLYGENDSKNTVKDQEEELFVMTSGNLLNLQLFQKTGPFLEKLFIDYVDIEYCLRLHSSGFKVIKLRNAVLNHSLGEHTTGKSFFAKRLLKSIYAQIEHNAVRRYYITRNRFFVMNRFREKFPEFRKVDFTGFWKGLIKIILFENDRFLKILNIVRGYMDYKRGRFGKYPY